MVAASAKGGDEVGAAAARASRYSRFDDLIRPRQQRRRDREAEGLGGREVDDEFELRRLLDGKVGGLGALRILST